MYQIYKAYVRKPEGEHIMTHNCHIYTKDLEQSRMHLYGELQHDYLPQIVTIDLAYIESSYPKESFELRDKINVKYNRSKDGVQRKKKNREVGKKNA